MDVDVIAPHELEDTYVAYLVANSPTNKGGQNIIPKTEEAALRKRFREYMQRVMLFSSPEKKLKIQSRLDDKKVKVTVY